MNQNIERIEVFLDESKEPLQVLTNPPFKVKLDTQNIPDGPHTLRVVTIFKGGKVEENVVDFEVDNLPSPFIDGIDDGQQVRGLVEFDVLTGDYEAPKSKGGLSITMAVLSTIVVLGLIWAFFAFSGMSTAIVAANAVQPEESKPAAANADHGKELYAAQCAGCHGANGEGGFGPALAGNPLVGEADEFNKLVTQGRGSMPPLSDLSDQDLADLRAYLSSLGGKSDTGAAAAPAASTASQGDVATGESVYGQQCAGCHGANGEGGFGPALAGNELLYRPAEFGKVVHEGRDSMPPFPQLADDKLVAIRAFLKTK